MEKPVKRRLLKGLLAGIGTLLFFVSQTIRLTAASEVVALRSYDRSKATASLSIGDVIGPVKPNILVVWDQGLNLFLQKNPDLLASAGVKTFTVIANNHGFLTPTAANLRPTLNVLMSNDRTTFERAVTENNQRARILWLTAQTTGNQILREDVGYLLNKTRRGESLSDSEAERLDSFTKPYWRSILTATIGRDKAGKANIDDLNGESKTKKLLERAHEDVLRLQEGPNDGLLRPSPVVVAAE